MKPLPSSKVYATWLALMRIMTGIIWLIHGVPKFTQSDQFMPPNGFITFYVTHGLQLTHGPYHWFLATLVQPHILLFAQLVRLGEVLVGLALVFGLLTRLGGFFGAVLALNYMAALGSVAGFNAWASLNACVLILSVTNFVLPTGRMLGVDVLLGARPRTRTVHAEFVEEHPLDGPSAPSAPP